MRKISTSGIITTVAGSTAGNSGDGGPALSAKFNGPIDVKFDAYGTLYLSDISNSRVRKITGYGIGAITGNNIVYVDSTDTLHNATSEGIWLSSSPSIAKIDSGTGVIYGIDTGTDTITYVVGSDSAAMELYVVAKTTDGPIGTLCTPISDDCDSPEVHISADSLKLCPGADWTASLTYVLDGFTVTYFNWTPANSVTENIGFYQQNSATITGPTTYCTDYKINVQFIGPNLITNGTFPWSMWPTCSTYNCMETLYANGCGTAGNQSGHIKLGGSWSDQNTGCPQFDSHTSDGTTQLLVNSINNFPPAGEQFQYFWGQNVALCPGKEYQFSYWERNISVSNNEINLPRVAIWYGNSGATNSLEAGDTVGAYKIDDEPVGAMADNICDTSWYFVYGTFIAGTGNFVCLSEKSYNQEFVVDDIQLQRIAYNSDSVYICPYQAPTESVSYLNFTPCVGTTDTFHIHGHVGDSISYTIHFPNGNTQSGTHTMTGTIWSCPITSSVTGTATFTITGVTTAPPAGCTYIDSSSSGVIFQSLPTVSVTDTAIICQGQASATLTYTATGSPTHYTLTWLSGGLPPVNNNTLSSTITLTGLSGLNPGLYSAHLSVSNGNGCSSNPVVIYLRVNPNPTAITLSNSVICVDSSMTATDATAGGTWSVQPSPGNISITSGGVVTGVAGGTGTVVYTLPTGCSATTSVTVNPLPVQAVNAVSVCEHITSAPLFVSTGLYYHITWIGTAPAQGFVNQQIGTLASGLTCNVNIPSNPAPGVYSGILTVTNISTGCASHVPITVTIKSLPGIMATGSLCLNQVRQMTDTPTLGNWTVINGTGSANIGFTSGMLIPTGSGNVKVIYTAPDQCADTTTITINPLPNPGTITTDNGMTHFCIGTTHVLSDTAHHGSWSSSNTNVASITGTTASPSTATLHIIHVGTSTITFTDTNALGCTNTTTINITADTNAVGPIIGVLGVCQGYTTPLFDGVPGGVWSSSNPGIASIDSLSGLVTGHNPGMVTIEYKLINACGVDSTTSTLVVNMPPYITAYSNLGARH